MARPRTPPAASPRPAPLLPALPSFSAPGAIGSKRASASVGSASPATLTVPAVQSTPFTRSKQATGRRARRVNAAPVSAATASTSPPAA